MSFVTEAKLIAEPDADDEKRKESLAEIIRLLVEKKLYSEIAGEFGMSMATVGPLGSENQECRMIFNLTVSLSHRLTISQARQQRRQLTLTVSLSHRCGNRDGRDDEQTQLLHFIKIPLRLIFNALFCVNKAL